MFSWGWKQITLLFKLHTTDLIVSFSADILLLLERFFSSFHLAVMNKCFFFDYCWKTEVINVNFYRSFNFKVEVYINYLVPMFGDLLVEYSLQFNMENRRSKIGSRTFRTRYSELLDMWLGVRKWFFALKIIYRKFVIHFEREIVIEKAGKLKEFHREFVMEWSLLYVK
jgi:hypothetical protein